MPRSRHRAEEALGDEAEAPRSPPRRPPRKAYRGLAIVLGRKGDAAGAEAALRAGVAADPRDAALADDLETVEGLRDEAREAAARSPDVDDAQRGTRDDPFALAAAAATATVLSQQRARPQLDAPNGAAGELPAGDPEDPGDSHQGAAPPTKKRQKQRKRKKPKASGGGHPGDAGPLY